MHASVVLSRCMRQALLHTVRNPCYSHTAAVTTAPAGHFSSSSSWPRCETPHSCRTGLLSAAGPQRLRVPVRLSRLSTSAQAPPSTTSAAADHPASTSQHSSAAPAQHTPVLLSEVLGFFADLQLRSFVDGTLGAGGHACAIATAHQELRTLVCIDQDQAAFAVAEQQLAAVRRDGLDVRLHQGNFRDMHAALQAALGGSRGTADGILLDLGVSSMQLDQAERGFSFMRDGPLDMRMGGGGPGVELNGGPGAAALNPLSAEALVNTADEAELGRMIRYWGEERGWRRIAARIVKSRDEKPIRTTQQLVAAIGGGRGRKGIHPATRTFQALRIAVNDELGALRDALPAAVDALAPGGRLAVISFHSLEDRIVKRAFLAAAGRPQADAPPADRQLSMLADVHPGAGPPATARILTKRPVMAGDEEQRGNPRSRSAKLRVLEKLPASE